MATRAPKAAVAMCVVDINYQSYLMSTANGLRMIELMKDAKLVDVGYSRDMKYYTRDEPVKLALEIIKASQVLPGPKPGHEIDEA